MSNPDSRHNYFAWPTIARLQNGKLTVVASGYRLRHICPFGKAVISYSEDEGKTYTVPAPVIDTLLDDRDAGILAFGEKNVIVTSFTLTEDAQCAHVPAGDDYSNVYLDTIIAEEEAEYKGSLFRISTDGGVTFGSIKKSPVSSPHGPIRLKDGSILCHIRMGDVQGKKFDTIYQSISRDGGRTFSRPEPYFTAKRRSAGIFDAAQLRHTDICVQLQGEAYRNPCYVQQG